jgi:hypothetical protein
VMCCNMFFKAGLLYYFADLLSIFSLLLLALCLCLCCRMMSAAAKFCFQFSILGFFPRLPESENRRNYRRNKICAQTNILQWNLHKKSNCSANGHSMMSRYALDLSRVGLIIRASEFIIAVSARAN